MSIISELIDNKSRDGLKCEQVLGSSARVKQVLSFYRNPNGVKALELIMTDGLLKFTSAESYNDRELAVYKMGLSYVLEFMQEAHEEYEANKKVDDNE